ncbi:MAG: ATP synthase subunit I [Pseudomonadales bacterium]
MLRKPPVYRLIGLQLLILAVVTMVLWFQSPNYVTSFGCGALIAIVPHAYFVTRVFRYAGARATPQVAQSFYRGEFGKFIMTAVGFALVFAQLRPISGLAVFLGFGLMVIIQLLGAWWFNRSPNR